MARVRDRSTAAAAGGRRGARGGVAKLLLLAGGLLAALAIAEAAVRVLKLAPRIHRINPEMARTVYRVSENPVLGYVFKENYRDAGNPDLKTSYPYINAHGFRDRERAYEKPAGVRRIILLGDSVVAGAVNIREIDDTISRKLEKALEGGNVEVLNMGINGYCTLAEVELLREKGLRYAPDLVIVVFTSNDYMNMNSELGMVTQPRAVRWLFVRSHLFRTLGIRFNLCRLRTEFGLQEVAGEWAGAILARDGAKKGREILGSDEATSATIKRHLLEMGDSNVHRAIPELAQLSREHGFRVLIGLWPMFREDSILQLESWGGEVRPVFETPTEIERLAAEHGIPAFRFAGYFADDFKAALARAGDAAIDPKNFYTDGDDMHPNAAGSAVAAAALAEILAQNPRLLGDPGGSPPVR